MVQHKTCQFISCKLQHSLVFDAFFLLHTLSDAIDDLDSRVKEFYSNGETATQQWKEENYKNLKQVFKEISSFCS